MMILKVTSVLRGYKGYKGDMGRTSITLLICLRKKILKTYLFCLNNSLIITFQKKKKNSLILHADTSNLQIVESSKKLNNVKLGWKLLDQLPKLLLAETNNWSLTEYTEKN
jgi:hypothetical protein